MSVLAGHYDPAFKEIAEIFEESFAAGRERGAALAVTVDGRLVVDVWGGTRDEEQSQPWERNTVVNVFSATKAVAALCAHHLAERGLLDLNAPVVTYWPEFGAAGKEEVTVSQLLDHSAGLPALREPLPPGTLFNWTAMTDALAAEEPWWEPGTRHGYHVVTFGFLVGEVLRRADGRSVRDLVRDEIAAPLGIDLFIGLPERLSEQAAYLPPTEPPTAAQMEAPAARALMDPTSMAARAFTNPADLVEPGLVNTQRWRQADIPASNGHANARALATMYGVLAAGGTVEGVHLLQQTVDTLARERVSGVDAVLFAPTRFSLGFMLPNELRPYSPGDRVFGHPGAGGALGFCDLDARMAFGYTPNRTVTTLHGADPRWTPLTTALYGCL
ncbi:MAG TPA: serine hydrolase domain-containing protein [Chloroflexota bacterium]